MLRVKLSKDRVIKLASIVCLEVAYWTGELRVSISMKRHDMFGGIRFVTQWEGPDKSAQNHLRAQDSTEIR